ncbi:MAG: EAL domain-containing protein, partial [Clostridia bacterium]
KDKDGDDSSIEEFTSFVGAFVAQLPKNKKCYLLAVSICDYEDIVKNVGEIQYRTMIDSFRMELKKIAPYAVKAVIEKQNKLLVFMGNTEGNSLENICKLIISLNNYKLPLEDAFRIKVQINVAGIIAPDDGDKVEALTNKLDIALINAKRKGEDNFVIYNPVLQSVESDEYKYFEEIKSAIKAKEFMLYYQPIVDTTTMEVVSTEALIRWEHRSKGIVMPSDFLYVMEKSGDIIWVGYWCFEQIVKQSLSWRANFEQQFTIGLNLSERQLLENGLADEFCHIAGKHSANPAFFIIEINDINLYSASDVAKSNIDRLKSYGFKIAIDGYVDSGVKEELIELCSAIKLSKNLWKGSQASPIKKQALAGLTEFAKEKSIHLVALGVEDSDDMLLLHNNNITVMQGYLFNRPQEPSKFISEVVMTPWSDQ